MVVLLVVGRLLTVLSVSDAPLLTVMPLVLLPVISVRLVMVEGRFTVPPTVMAPVALVLPNTSVPAVMLLSAAWDRASVPAPVPRPSVVDAVFGWIVTVWPDALIAWLTAIEL